MTNIFNKTVLVNNGTLIGNWYEEEVLKTKTGIGRTIPGKHVPKKAMDFDVDIINNNPRDNTFSRIMGEKVFAQGILTNSTYGNFSQPENKYKKIGIKEKMFDDLFKTYVRNEKSEKIKLQQNVENVRLFNTTNKNNHVAQPVDYAVLGHRHMLTQDNIPIPQ